MQLANPFPVDVRVLFMDVWECWICGTNGTTRGGLELHHIYGRISSSALNAAPLCHVCHSHIGHAMKEEQTLLRKTILYLQKLKYRLTLDDHEFLELIKNELQGFVV